MDDAYASFVDLCAKAPEEILESLTPEKVDLWHMATGVGGEAGELEDAIKKHVIYNKPLDRDHIMEEIGDLLFYVRRIMTDLDMDMEEVINNNIAKLSKRYEAGYSDKAAQERADKK